MSTPAEPRTVQSFVPPRPDPRVIAALSGEEAARERALALKTRRSVFNAMASRRSDSAGERRSLLLALLLTGALTLALAPALWAGVDDVLAGESILELPGMLAAFGVTLIAAMAAALFLISGERRAPEHARRQRR